MQFACDPVQPACVLAGHESMPSAVAMNLHMRRPGMLTQGGQQEGRLAPLASRFIRVPTHFPLDLYGI